jgi:flagellin
MSLGVLNNIAAIYAQNNLNQTQSSLQNTLTQLSSGSRINSGADDAAGLAVVDGLGANVSALTQSSQNASDGIGLLQTADGALSQVTSLLNRAVTLATESANGTLNSNQVSSANQEYQNILSEIGNIGSKTNFNSNQVFTANATTVFVSDGTSSGATSFAETVGTLSTSSVGITAPGTSTTSTLTNPAASTSTASTAATETLSFGSAADTVGGSFSLTYAGTTFAGTITSGSTLAQSVTQLNASFGSSGITAAVGTGANANKIILTGTADTGTAGTNSISFNTGNAVTDTTVPTTVAAAGVNFSSPATGAGTATDISQLNAGSAANVLTSVTSAIGDVAYQRGVIGADINELTAASNVASAESENLTSAQSSIQSTNYGQATSDLAKYQVLSQTGISALAQANSVQQEVLKLLQ